MGKPYKLAVTYGRFNLLHNGHQDLFQKMADLADEMCIGISVGGGASIPYRQRADAITKVTEDLGVVHWLFPKEQPFKLLDSIPTRELDPRDIVFCVGEDQYSLAQAFNRTCGWATYLNPRQTSSTQIRQLVDNEQWDLLSLHIPASVVKDVIDNRYLEKQRDA